MINIHMYKIISNVQLQNQNYHSKQLIMNRNHKNSYQIIPYQFIKQTTKFKLMQKINKVYDIEKYKQGKSFIKRRRVMIGSSLLTIVTNLKNKKIQQVTFQLTTKDDDDLYSMLFGSYEQSTSAQIIGTNASVTLSSIDNFLEQVTQFELLEQSELKLTNGKQFFKIKLQDKYVDENSIFKYRFYSKELTMKSQTKSRSTVENVKKQDKNKNEQTNENLKIEEKKKNKVCQEKEVAEKQIEQILIVDPNSAFRHKFNIEDSIIEFKEYDGWNYQLLGSMPISRKKVNSFTLQKTKQRFYCLGITSRNYIFDQNSVWQGRKECILYYVYNGSIWMGGKWQGCKLKSKLGEKIIMTVDGQTITWKVGNELRQSFSHVMIADSSCSILLISYVQ